MISLIFLSLIAPKRAKTREPKDERCVLQCTLVYVTPYLPIDNCKTHLHPALPYITIQAYKRRPRLFGQALSRQLSCLDFI